MNKRTIWISSAAGAAALALGGAAIAFAAPTPSPSGSDGADRDDDRVLVGAELDAASEAALAETGGGTVVDSEADSDRNSTYEIEVLLDDGTVSEVELDADFAVVHVENDGPDDDGADDEADDLDDADDD